MEDNVKGILEGFFKESSNLLGGMTKMIEGVREGLTDDQKKIIDDELKKLDMSEINKEVANLTKDIKDKLSKM
jgi:hypothetical protein